jgi:hypothetical protein
VVDNYLLCPGKNSSVYMCEFWLFFLQSCATDDTLWILSFIDFVTSRRAYIYGCIATGDFLRAQETCRTHRAREAHSVNSGEGRALKRGLQPASFVMNRAKSVTEKSEGYERSVVSLLTSSLRRTDSFLCWRRAIYVLTLSVRPGKTPS